MYTKSTIFTSFVYTERCFKQIANLLKLLWRSVLLPIEAYQLCVSEVCKLEAQYLGDNAFWNDIVKQI